MSDYKPIPQDSTKVYLDNFSCGTDCCGCIYFIIWSNTPQKIIPDRFYRKRLWESDTLYYEDASKEEIQELREEVIAAANHYGITLVDIDSDCLWDWESI